MKGNEAGKEGRKQTQGGVLWSLPQLHKRMCGWLLDHVNPSERPYCGEVNISSASSFSSSVSCWLKFVT